MATAINNSSDSLYSPCGYAFLGETHRFHFRGVNDLSDDTFLNRTKASVPIVLDWAIGTGTLTCMETQLSFYNACKNNSECVDSDTGHGGYRCSCKPDFQGNPYLTPGCQDIDECADPRTNSCEKNCTNTPGSFYCSCPNGYTGDGKNDSRGCIAPSSEFLWIKFSVGTLSLPTYCYTAKVADFGASRLIPLDQTHVATLVQGLKPLSRDRNDEQKNFADHFVSSVNNNRLLQILDRPVLREGNFEQLQKMAELVKSCLQLHGEDSPTMKEVATKIEGLRKLKWNLLV
ncbi:hypothetical protein K7X08_007102 [Anisodus acutangulus]|uniref:EGF-like domain-containing protein n=1 Tax=Anisodus acutangulus TaxID=402998 RepID=A0A9Q1QZL4_9SOLA|nr:hypothetical protein K7X08_007102 [Anisodus acutangulus]